MKKSKTLLEEGSVRRFMKLAAITPLTESFVDTLYEEEEDEEGGEDEDPGAMDLGADAADLDVEEPAPGDEELDLDEPAADVGEADIESLVSAIADAIEAETGVEVSVEGEPAAEEPELEEPGLEEPGLEEPELGEPGEELPGGEAGLEEPAPEEEGAEEELFMEGVVSEVARRVAARLLYETQRRK